MSPEPVTSPTRAPGRTAGGTWYTAIASWYGAELYGHRTACGQLYGPSLLGVAHKTLPCGTRITFRRAGRVVTVPVVDRGPYIAGRTWDLSNAAAGALAFRAVGVGTVEWRYAG